MSIGTGLMEYSLAYRAWQAPFAEAKLAPIVRHNDLAAIRRVLDVGCGPGTNTRHFAHADYLGIDFNERYIADARAKYGRPFVVADVTTYTVPAGERFDFILANSFFHHIDTPNTARILSHLGTLLADDGHVHILDLVLPGEPSVARRLAEWDRGEYPRPLGQWWELFSDAFEPVLFETYPLQAFGVTLWNMVYFKGRARR
jgi:SAM-dependent methyltransferase